MAIVVFAATLTLILQLSPSSLAIPASGTANIAHNKPATASKTCGIPAAETYYAVSQMSVSPRNRQLSTCDASNPSLAHSASNLVDDNTATWWQSTASVDTTNITISLTGPAFKHYYVETIQIIFGEYYRPGQMAFYKSTDNGQTFTPWHYYVSHPDPGIQCQAKFGVPLQKIPWPLKTPLCYGYTEINAQSKYQIVEWRPPYSRGELTNPSKELLEWMNVTDIRLEFISLARVFDALATRWHHYAVREVKVHGYCSCNGQGAGCQYNNTAGDFQCICQTGTCGYYCDQCCPAYNQHPWRKGSKGPLVVDPSSACQPCNCHNHSSVCVFNETIAQRNASLDITGNYSGGGVCQNCQHNTEGINCESCEPFYYRPSNRSRSALKACEACNCSIAGTYNHSLPGVLYLDCVRESGSIANMSPGDCFCKNNTMGRRCDLCKPGYFNLSAENPEGCQVCVCDEAGTVNGSRVCHADRVGQCPCKVNVDGLRCDTCNDTYYGLSKSDQNGCRSCTCDVGGSSGPICNKTMGQCTCLPNIEGRQCDRPKDDYYYPELHFMGGAMAHNSQNNSWVTGFDVVPGVNAASGLFILLVAYQSTTEQSVTITVTSSEGTVSHQVTLPSCNQTCYHKLTAFGELKLNGSVTVSVSRVSNVFKGVRAVTLPKEFYEATVLGDRLAAFTRNCSALTNDVKAGSDLEQLCKKGVFTITTDYLGKALACACDAVGSVNSTCQKYGGQCHCKAGVTGRMCDQCQPGFYNFTTAGCSACNCAADSKVCNPVTGQCKCPPKTVGRMCDACNATYWGWNATTGCQACNCDLTGSSDLQCNLTNGICSCNPGVTLSKCTECKNGYKNFSSVGCTACGCDQKGSLHSVCNKTSGQCPCKNNTVSLTCDQCEAGTFYLTQSNPIGCMGCICSGITTNCTSTTQYMYQRSVDVNQWVLGEETNVAIVDVSQAAMPGNGMVMLRGNISTSQDLYWKAHANFTKDSLVGSYGGNLSFMLHMTNLSGATLQPNVKVILKGSNGVSIESPISPIPVNQTVTRTVQMKETSWVYTGTSNPVSRAHFMLVLAKSQDILMTASLYSSGDGYYITSFGGVGVSGVHPSLTAGSRAFEVEQCACGPEYTGLSCERCAPGHHRVNVSGDPFFGKCVPCNCNGHTSDCYANTGVCYNCKHNTTGDHCELCSDGYYGNSTDGTPGDCKRCPCDAPRTTSSLCKDVAGSPVCLNCSTGYEGSICGSCQLRYFGKPLTPGGNCSLCQCNNNTDICNTRTGECTNCKYNTTGVHCERCENGTYGDATKQQCQACLCDGIGSHHNVCDHRIGQCSCKPNVGERNCSKCQRYSYGFSPSGCTRCGCNAHGSSNLQCNDTGVCECKNHTLGEKCDTCAWGYFGLPNKPCQACACNDTGSNNHTRCDRVSGQCFCKPGVAGRQCDRCSVQHVNFTTEGCDECPMCTRLGLQGTINQTRLTLKAADDKAREVDKLKVLKPELQKLFTRIQATQVLITEFDKRISTVRSGLELMKSNTLNKNVTDLQNQITSLSMEAATLRQNASRERTRVETIYNSTLQARDLVDSINGQAKSIAAQLNSLRVSADAMLASYGFVNQTYSSQLARVNQELTSTRATYILSETARNNTVKQRIMLESLNSTVIRDQSSFLTMQTEFKAISSRVDAVTGITATVHSIVNQTKNLIAQGESVIAQSRQVLKEADILLSTSWAQIIDAQRAYEDTRMVLKGSVGVQGVEDLLRSLNSSVPPTHALLLAANRSVTVNGTQHAANLTAEALQRKSAFDAVQNHGRLAVEAIKQYESVVKLVNQSLEASLKVNASLQEIMKYLRNFTVSFSAMDQRAQSAYNKSKALLEKAQARTIDIAALQTNLTAANQTFLEASRVGRTVAEYHNLLLSRSNLLIAMSEPGQSHSVIKEITQAWSYARLANDISNPLLANANTFIVEVARLDTSMAYINHSAEHSRQLMQKALVNVQNASTTLPNVVNAVQDAHVQRNLTASIQEQLKVNMTRLQEKLRQVKEKVAKIQHALALKGNTSVQYTPTSRQAQDTAYNDIALDFRADHNVGPLFYYAEGGIDTSSLALTLVYSQYVRFTFDLGSGPISITNWEVSVRQGKWYRVYASRYNKNGRLTITDYSTNYSRTYESNTQLIVPRTNMKFTVSSPLLIGGLPSGAMPNETHRFFHGCIDNVVVNQDPVSLWKPLRVNGNRYACSKCLVSASQPLLYSIVPGTSFFGSPETYIKQSMGTFDISHESEMSFQFRTFLKTASVLNVLSNEGYIYGIYLNASRVTFYFKNASRLYAVSSNKTSYNDGRWYNLRVVRGLTNATLIITSVRSQEADSAVISWDSPVVLPTGSLLVFGGKEPQSPFLAPVSDQFAGAIRLLNVSSNTNQPIVPRHLNDKALTQTSDQVDLCGVLQNVEETIRFRGNSYAGLVPGVTDMSSLSIKFKTLNPSGFLVYSGDSSTGYYFYLALFHGNLYLVNTKTPNAYTHVMTTRQTLNDGAYHTVTITFLALGLRLDVDEGRIVRSVDLGKVAAGPVKLNGTLFVGGLRPGTNITLSVPVVQPFVGEMKYINVNGRAQNIFSGHTNQVSLAGGSLELTVVPTPLPTIPPPTEPPPTCGDTYPPFSLSKEPDEVNLEPGNYVGFSPSSKVLRYIESQGVVTLEFRSLSPNGVMLYGADNITHPHEFISVELVNGRIVFKYDTGMGMVRVESNFNNYSSGGQWYRVNLLRINQFGALFVPDTKDYKNARHGDSKDSLTINTPIFLGGVKPGINTSLLETGGASFIGCMRTLSLQTSNETEKLNPRTQRDEKLSAVSNKSCYNAIQAQASFNGEGQILLNNDYTVPSTFDMSLKFRTIKRSGLLVVLTNQTGNGAITLEQLEGQVILTFTSESNKTVMPWTDPTIPPEKKNNASYRLCDNKFHEVRVQRANDRLTLTVDKHSPLTFVIQQDFQLTGRFYIGGVPDGSGAVSHSGFSKRRLEGCVESLRLDTKYMELLRSPDVRSQGVTVGCRAPRST